MSFVPAHHTNPTFNDALASVGVQLHEMAGLCMKALEEACAALASGDRDQARQIYREDGRINKLEEEVTANVASILARHNPVAHDLHALMGSIKTAQELERLADHAKNIGRRIARLAEHDVEVTCKQEVIDLGCRTREMLTTFIAAIENDDLEQAARAWSMDKGVNDVYHRVMARTLEDKDGDPRVLVNTAFIAKNFERIGDKVKNLAEIAHYQKTGEIVDLDDGGDDEDSGS